MSALEQLCQPASDRMALAAARALFPDLDRFDEATQEGIVTNLRHAVDMALLARLEEIS